MEICLNPKKISAVQLLIPKFLQERLKCAIAWMDVRDGGTKIAILLVLHPSPSTKKCGNKWEIKIDVSIWSDCQDFIEPTKPSFEYRNFSDMFLGAK